MNAIRQDPAPNRNSARIADRLLRDFLAAKPAGNGAGFTIHLPRSGRAQPQG